MADLSLADDEDDPAAPVDGRHARSARSKARVVDAILDLLNEGVERPTAEQISQRSGVSVRSIFRHFDDLESLYANAVTRHLQRVGPLFEAPPPGGPLAGRIDALVSRRAELYERIAPVRRSAERLRGRSEVIAGRLDASRRLLRDQLGILFEPELAERSADERNELLDAIEVATSWRTWNTLRVEQGCSRRRATAVVRRTVHALLAADG